MIILSQEVAKIVHRVPWFLRQPASTSVTVNFYNCSPSKPRKLTLIPYYQLHYKQTNHIHVPPESSVYSFAYVYAHNSVQLNLMCRCVEPPPQSGSRHVPSPEGTILYYFIVVTPTPLTPFLSCGNRRSILHFYSFLFVCFVDVIFRITLRNLLRLVFTKRNAFKIDPSSTYHLSVPVHCLVEMYQVCLTIHPPKDIGLFSVRDDY